MYDIEALYEANTVKEAILMLSEHPEAKIIAGGSDVLIKIREGSLAACTLVSIQRLDELRGISLEKDGALRIGALSSFSRITANLLIQAHIPVLGDAVSKVGGPQVRNIGTIGGNVCNGVTSADSASTLVAYDALMEYHGPDGIRLVPITEHYVAAGKTALKHEEILCAIIIPKESYQDTFGHYIKYAMRNAMDIATLACSVNVRLSDDKKKIERLRVAFGVAGPVPMRAAHSEQAANGKAVCEETIKAAAQAVLEDIKPRTSWRASKELRAHLAVELVKRAAQEAIIKAGGLK
jgi:xanthine dehydrogenase FAD-binding subunit